jgi:hypothetical protein
MVSGRYTPSSGVSACETDCRVAKMQELANYRSLDSAIQGTSTQSKNQLIEEKDFVGADIAA